MLTLNFKKSMKVKELFGIVPMNEEEKSFTIVLPGGRATMKEFETVEEAENYIGNYPWDLIASVVAYIVKHEKEMNDFKIEETKDKEAEVC